LLCIMSTRDSMPSLALMEPFTPILTMYNSSLIQPAWQ